MNDLLLRLRDKGNTVLVIEHKPETIAIADHVVDLADLEQLVAAKTTLTSGHLAAFVGSRPKAGRAR